MSRIFDRYLDKAKKILRDNWTGSYTKPSPGLYPHQWNWDSGFIAIGKSHYDTKGAIAEIESLFESQWTNGMVPQIVFNPDVLGHYFPEPDFWQTERSPHLPEGRLTSGITMPPVHAIAAEHIYEYARDREGVVPFLKRIYPKLLALHGYLYRERDPDNEGLIYIRHPWESGIDNSPAWDIPLKAIRIDGDSLPDYRRKDLEHDVSPEMRPSDEDYDRYVYLVDLFRRTDYDEEAIRQECPFLVQDPLFNSILCRANQSLVRIAAIIGEPADTPRSWMERTEEGIRTKLWCLDNRMFYPFDMVAGQLIYAETSSGFLPLFAGAATPEQAEVLYSRLDTVSFCSLHQGNCYTIPNYDTQMDDFDRSNYWRGPVWININWMLTQGLARYGYTLKADSLRRDLLQLPIRFGFHEYFDSFSGEGYGSDNFSWTTALFIDLVEELYSEDLPKPGLGNLARALLAPKRILNSGSEEPSCSLEELSGELMKSIRAMRDSFYDTGRGIVDYEDLGKSDQFREYRILSNGLKIFDLDALEKREDQLAFWINLYNTLVVDAIVTLGVRRSVLGHPGFFHKVSYQIGERSFSLNDMEHGVLRRNRRGPNFPLGPFLPGDGRKRWMVEDLDPRIHFALVCGSRSCAPIDYYDPLRIDDQLDDAARAFINSSEVLVFPEEDRVLLSEIFQWYERDFGGRSGIIDFICRYLADGEIRDYLLKRGSSLEFEYLFYDWDLNRWGK